MRLVGWLRQRSQAPRRAPESDVRERYPSDPFGTRPLADRQIYLQLYEAAKAEEYPEIDAFETTQGAAIDRVWLDELALRTQVVVKSSKLNYQHGRVLYAALSSYLARVPPEGPLLVFETGTARGFSALCMARAMLDAQVPGFVVTVDLLPHDRPMIWNCIRDADGPASRRQLLGGYERLLERVIFLQASTDDALGRLGLERIHFAFLDGEHTREAVGCEVAFVSARQKPGDRILFDDVTPAQYPGVVAAIEDMATEGRYAIERIRSSDARGYALATRIA